MYKTVASATQTSFITDAPSLWSGTAADPASYKYLDLPQCASLVNRRTYRSGMLYPFSIEVVPQTAALAGAATKFRVEVLPTNFPLRQAFKMAKEAFLKATEDEREMLKSARWNDFRVFFDDQHADFWTAGQQNLLPDMVNHSEAAAMDTGYEYSKISNREVAATYQQFGFLGTSANDFLGMLYEYELSVQASQAAPDPVGIGGDIPYDSIIEQVDELDAEALMQVNEFPPYDELILQYNLQRYDIGIQNGTGANIPAVPLQTSTPIIMAPCGLVRIQNISVDANNDAKALENVQFRVNMLSGNYRGLEAGKMI